jgi:hypothetical protein
MLLLAYLLEMALMDPMQQLVLVATHQEMQQHLLLLQLMLLLPQLKPLL